MSFCQCHSPKSVFWETRQLGQNFPFWDQWTTYIQFTCRDSTFHAEPNGSSNLIQHIKSRGQTTHFRSLPYLTTRPEIGPQIDFAEQSAKQTSVNKVKWTVNAWQLAHYLVSWSTFFFYSSCKSIVVNLRSMRCMLSGPCSSVPLYCISVISRFSFLLFQ